MYNGTENKQLQALVLRQLQNLKLNEDIDRLQRAVDKFKEDKGRLPQSLLELVRAGYVDRIPEEDPYGGRYYLDKDKVQSTTPPSERG
jgi:predicted transcriptional regulator